LIANCAVLNPNQCTDAALIAILSEEIPSNIVQFFLTTTMRSLLQTLLICAFGLAIVSPLFAQSQENKRIPVYGEFGFGYGQTLFFGDIRTKLSEAIQAGDFTPNSGFNTVLAFYLAPENWSGFGLGARAKVFAATPSRGTQNERYFFNYYHAGFSGKWYALTQKFNEGAYIRGAWGFGQLTAKRDNSPAKEEYLHQFAVGSTLLGGLGWTFTVGAVGISIEAEFETSLRNGTITNVGEGQLFRSGQIGLNCLISF
jgi:hypothetical protein